MATWIQWLLSLVVVVLVAQSCPTLCDPMDCSPPGSSVHGILQARILEWIAIPFSRGSFWPRDQTRVFFIAGRFFTVWATGKITLSLAPVYSFELKAQSDGLDSLLKNNEWCQVLLVFPWALSSKAPFPSHWVGVWKAPLVKTLNCNFLFSWMRTSESPSPIFFHWH